MYVKAGRRYMNSSWCDYLGHLMLLVKLYKTAQF